jgi:hypothetical protein
MREFLSFQQNGEVLFRNIKNKRNNLLAQKKHDYRNYQARLKTENYPLNINKDCLGSRYTRCQNSLLIK